MDVTFKNKVIIITGSTQGIGKRTAEILAEMGASVVINSRSSEKVIRITRELKAKGYDVLGVHGDISDYTFCLELRQKVISHFGKVDILINNAGVAVSGKMDETQSITFERTTQINLFGSIYPTKVFLPDLISSKGSILFISSLAGIVGLPGFVAYSFEKRAIISMAESLKNEIHGSGVFVGINFPGFTENDAEKRITLADGSTKILAPRTSVKIEKLDSTVRSVIQQLKNKKFRTFTTFKGKMLFNLYRFSPNLTLYLLQLNRKRIMES